MEGDISTIFKSGVLGEEYLRLYDELLTKWPRNTNRIDVPTSYGLTHINVTGPEKAPVLVLLPGFAANSTMWFANIGTLSQRFRALAVDTIGQPGRSIPSQSVDASTTAAWLKEVLDQLAVSKANIAGVSLGGWIALDFALKHPQRVNRIALLDPAASFARMTTTFMLHSLFPIMIHPTRKGLVRYFRWLTRGKAVNSQWGELMVLGILGCKPQPPIRAVPFTDDQLRSCLIPSKLIVGEKSVIYDPTKAVSRAAKFMPRVSTEVVPEVSHGLLYEQADLVNSRLLSFFGEAE